MKGLLAASLIILSSVSVMAKSCNRGGVYCGSSLLRRGNYRDHIVETLKAAGIDADEIHIQNGIFHCLNNGEIHYYEFCEKGCGGTDSTAPDYCF
ncbi:hypothetical protein P280DRAFT_546656 [Massarina eburnea CBS 473.64]|uniref:Killer toxin Kp4 domain-containing protein n=1 Tax=Massarina eburnea CBS 473.64 TaxID=1395130 RepID=A0A6A6S7U8_9PLEO|nr:hypothetical protein P280DRAFT_546656 [Massarina eburnea CBS 473.64]